MLSSATALARAATAVLLTLAAVGHARYDTASVMQYYQGIGAVPLPGVRKCALKHLTGPPSPQAASAPAHNLTIIMSLSADRIPTQLDNATTDAWQHYAKMHGYTFTIHRIPHDPSQAHLPIRNSQHIYYERWRAIERAPGLWAGTGAGSATHVLHIDSDTLPIGVYTSLTPFLAMQQDVVLHVRENYEVAAAAVLLRTTPYARCFLHHWLGYSSLWAVNVDNGDLVQAVMDFVDPEAGYACQEHRPRYAERFLPCFQRAHARLLGAHLNLPFRFLFPLGGFLRSHEGLRWQPPQQAPPWDVFFFYCWSFDVIGHGWKQMGSMWLNRTADGRPSCHFLDTSQELDVAQQCCMWHYPGCTDLSTGFNSCRHSPHCRPSSLGVPTCTRTYPRPG